MGNFFKAIILSFCLACSLSLYADNVKIFGTVKDNEDMPVEFGTVRISGTTIGTNTDLQGKYSLTVAAQDTI